MAQWFTLVASGSPSIFGMITTGVVVARHFEILLGSLPKDQRDLTQNFALKDAFFFLSGKLENIFRVRVLKS